MNEEFKKLLELQKKSILLDKKRLGVIKDEQFTDNVRILKVVLYTY